MFVRQTAPPIVREAESSDRATRQRWSHSLRVSVLNTGEVPSRLYGGFPNMPFAEPKPDGYPFLEVGSPLVILPDHDLDAAFPVLPFCGDGL